MNYKKTITLLVIGITILTLVATLIGIFSNQGTGEFEFTSINGEVITIYGKGIYKHESVSGASQVIAQDIVTLILGIPLLLISLYLFLKNTVKGKLLLAGTLGYLLYTYMSYSFLCNYNVLFIVYVLNMSACFYALILTFMSIDINHLSSQFEDNLPVKSIGGIVLFIGVVVGLMWIGRLAPSWTEGSTPVGIEHYTTLIIQAMDLGFIVPTAIIAGVLIRKRKPFGYLLSSFIIIKGFTMLTAMTAMMILMAQNGVEVSLMEFIIFPIFNLLIMYYFFILLKSCKEKPIT